MQSTFLFVALTALAATATAGCPASSQLSGTFATEVAKGYMPNRLVITRTEKGGYQASLTSYWAPVPNDDGTLGTIGDYEGKLFLSKPWKCVARFSRPEKTCHLTLRFVGAKTVYVETSGECEAYHGANAYPQGQYEKQ